MLNPPDTHLLSNTHRGVRVGQSVHELQSLKMFHHRIPRSFPEDLTDQKAAILSCYSSASNGEITIWSGDSHCHRDPALAWLNKAGWGVEASQREVDHGPLWQLCMCVRDRKVLAGFSSKSVGRLRVSTRPQTHHSTHSGTLCACECECDCVYVKHFCYFLGTIPGINKDLVRTSGLPGDKTTVI